MEVEGARPMLRIAVPLVCWNVRAPRNCLAEFLIDPDSPSSSFSMAKERESERGRERESARERERFILASAKNRSSTSGCTCNYVRQNG